MYENSRFLKNRFTFCGVNTNFGQQWAPPAYHHLTPIVSKGKRCNIYRFCFSGNISNMNQPSSTADKHFRSCILPVNDRHASLFKVHSLLVMPMNLQMPYQSGRSPKVVALFSATNFSSYIIELLQLHDKIPIKWNYAWIHDNIAIRRHLMI